MNNYMDNKSYSELSAAIILSSCPPNIPDWFYKLFKSNIEVPVLGVKYPSEEPSKYSQKQIEQITGYYFNDYVPFERDEIVDNWIKEYDIYREKMEKYNLLLKEEQFLAWREYYLLTMKSLITNNSNNG